MKFTFPQAPAPCATPLPPRGVAVSLTSCGGGTSSPNPCPGRSIPSEMNEQPRVRLSQVRRQRTRRDSGRVDCPQPTGCSIASGYGFVFAECIPLAGRFCATSYAAWATVADVAAQVDAQTAAGGFRSDDLALVIAGANDLLALYAEYPQRSEQSLLEAVQLRGQQLAQTVNRLVALGAKVVVSNQPDFGVSPFAQAEKDRQPTPIGRRCEPLSIPSRSLG